MRIRINGTVVQSGNNTRTLEWSGDVVDGDLVDVQALKTQQGATVTTGSIDITPL